MKGWKTWAAAIGLTILGIIDIANGQAETGIAKVVSAFGAIGIGHKIEKAKGSHRPTQTHTDKKQKITDEEIAI